jgi:Fur family ferric uptake transcriptional regulator
MVYTEKRIINALRKKHYKITPQRRIIIGVIIDSHGHLTPSAIHKRALREDNSIGLVTIYRTIEILTKLGLICEMHTGEICRSYTMRRPSEHHHHLICSDCGRVIDFTDCNLDKLERRLTQENHFKIESHLLEFLGQCRECRSNNDHKNKPKSREKVGV